MRTACQVIDQLVGLRLTPGGLAQLVQRVGRRVEAPYEALIRDLRAAAATFVDETIWYMGGPGYWLWVFTTTTETVYRVESRRGREVVTDTLGSEFAGVLVSDCLAGYDGVPYRTHKCIAHHLKAIAVARDRPDTPDHSYLDELKMFFRTVIGIGERCPKWTRMNSHAGEAAWKSGSIACWPRSGLSRGTSRSESGSRSVAVRS
jgi:transposase